MEDIGGFIIGAVMLYGLVSGGAWLWNQVFSDQTESSYEHSHLQCIEPENPYSPGTGHYAGFEWGEKNGYCTYGNSDSFYEGRVEWESEDSAYAECTG